jgi:hypothetical protein
LKQNAARKNAARWLAAGAIAWRRPLLVAHGCGFAQAISGLGWRCAPQSGRIGRWQACHALELQTDGSGKAPDDSTI